MTKKRLLVVLLALCLAAFALSLWLSASDSSVDPGEGSFYPDFNPPPPSWFDSVRSLLP
jgi:hypothetical protein